MIFRDAISAKQTSALLNYRLQLLTEIDFLNSEEDYELVKLMKVIMISYLFSDKKAYIPSPFSGELLDFLGILGRFYKFNPKEIFSIYQAAFEELEGEINSFGEKDEEKKH